MKLNTFLIRLFVLSLVVALALFVLHSMEEFAPYFLLSWGSFIFFIFFSFCIFLLGRKGAASKNKQLFSQIFLGATVIKLFVSLSLVLAYFFTTNPASKFFILPFFFVYFCYTVFEVYFMTKLGNS
jgi:hypothetical protein